MRGRTCAEHRRSQRLRRFALSTDRPPISRRSFAAEITLGAMAAVIAALWAVREWFHSRPSPARRIAGASEIPVGGFKIFSYPRGDTPCILIRPAEDSYLAFSRICTHNSCPVSYNAARGEFDCPCHGGIFSAATGSVLAGPPPRPLPRILLERRGDEIFATGMAAN